VSVVVVVGAGQAGLAVSRELRLAGVEHVVLERGRIAQAWRDRWDSFTLVTPNWTLDLPGSPYDGDDPEGHVNRDEIVRYLERYATGEVREGVRVDSIHPGGATPSCAWRRARVRSTHGLFGVGADAALVATAVAAGLS
jgi:putative flavoprotein involved in K+ transport